MKKLIALIIIFVFWVVLPENILAENKYANGYEQLGKIGTSAIVSTLEVNNIVNDNSEVIDIEVCETIPKILREYIVDALKVIRWIGLVAMIILGVLDFTKAVASDDQDLLKKSWGHFTKRLIAVIILFIIPLLVEFSLNIVGVESCSF